MLRAGRGFSLIELLVGLAVIGVLFGLAVPAFNTMINNFQIRTAAEAMISGLQTAKNEAVRRNAVVRFQLVNSLDAECDVTGSGPHWIISRNDVTAKCNIAEVTAYLEPNDTALPQALQKRFADTGSATIAATSAGAPAGSVVFNNLGRVAAGGIDQIDIANPSGGACEHAGGGPMRCMRILVRTGGQIKMCDPKVTVTTDSRYCQ